MIQGRLRTQRPLKAGLRIASSPEQIGSIGAVVFDRTSGDPLLLSVHHVFARWGSDGAIWQPAPCGKPGCSCCLVGKYVRGKRSIVPWQDHWYFVDAAVASIDSDVEWQAAPTSTALPRRGTSVTKRGANTGLTRGILAEQDYVEKVRFGPAQMEVPNQLLLRPTEGGPFAAQGDSGALVYDDDERAVGLLWGADSEGYGVACPIGPVLEALDVRFKEN